MYPRKYIKSLNETLIAVVITIVIFIPLTIWFSTHETRDSTSYNFKCPSEYRTSEEYVEGAAQWIKSTINKNPKISNDEILKLRENEFEKHKCDPSPWLLEKDTAIKNKSVDWKLDVSLAGIKYKFDNSSKSGDYWIANYYSATTSSNQLDPRVIVFYIPPYSISASSDGTEVSTERIADNFAYHMEEDGLTLLNPISFTDPKNPSVNIYVLTSYILRTGNDNSVIFFTIIRQTDSGVFAVLYHKEIENDIDDIMTKQRILEWLNSHNEYLENLSQLDSSDFLEHS